MTLEKIFPWFKYGVYALLALNIVLFFEFAAAHEGIDSLGWVILLAAFEWQTREQRQPSPANTGYGPASKLPHTLPGKILLYGIHTVAYGLILYAWAQYYLHRDWVDFLNETLWLAIVVLIEIDVYLGPQNRWRTHWFHYSIKSLLYTCLLFLAIIWGLEGDWLDFYDGVLWIVCFFAIEMNLLMYFYNRRAMKPL